MINFPKVAYVNKEEQLNRKESIRKRSREAKTKDMAR